MKKGSALRVLDLLRAITKPSVGLVTILALTFYLRLLYFGQYIDADVGNLGYLGWRMAEGEVLLDLEGPGKPPLYFMLYSLFIRLFGPSVLGLKLFGAFFVLMAVIAVYWLAKEAYGNRVGLLSALLFGIFSSAPMVEGGGVNLEAVLHLPYILAVGFFLKASESGRLRWYFLTGMCAALATLVKQVGGVLFFIFLCYGIYEWWKKPPSLSKKRLLSRYLLLGIGALLPVIGMISFYHIHGYRLAQIYDSMLGSNLLYIRRGHQRTDFLENFFASMKFILPENGLLWLGTMFTSAYLIGRIRHNKGRPSDRILLWWGFWSFALLCIVGTFFAHYFLQIIAPFSVLTAYGIVTAWKWAKSLSPLSRSVAKGVWIMLLGIPIIIFIKTDYEYFFTYTPEEKTMFQYKGLDGMFDSYGIYNVVQNGIALHIRAHSDPAETIYVWGISPQVYFIAQRKAATRYRTNYNVSQLVTDKGLQALVAYAPILMEDLKKSHPVYIVQIFPLEFFQDFQTFVQEHYRIEMDLTLNVAPYNVRLYRRGVDKEVVPTAK